MKLRLTSARSDPTQLGDLLMLVPFNVVQNKNLSRSRRQLCYRIRQVHSLNVHRRPCNFGPTLVADIGFISSRGFLALGLSRVQYHVHRQTVQPGGKSALSSELRQLFPCPHENILGELLALGPATRHPGAQRVHPVGVQPVQAFEGLAVPGCGQSHVRGVTHRYRYHVGACRHSIVVRTLLQDWITRKAQRFESATIGSPRYCRYDSRWHPTV
jgi:hypothetical protein